MTRKQIQAIADAIDKNSSDHDISKVFKMPLVKDLCTYFKSTNPKFNEDKFINACYGR